MIRIIVEYLTWKQHCVHSAATMTCTFSRNNNLILVKNWIYIRIFFATPNTVLLKNADTALQAHQWIVFTFFLFYFFFLYTFLLGSLTRRNGNKQRLVEIVRQFLIQKIRFFFSRLSASKAISNPLDLWIYNIGFDRSTCASVW